LIQYALTAEPNFSIFPKVHGRQAKKFYEMLVNAIDKSLSRMLLRANVKIVTVPHSLSDSFFIVNFLTEISNFTKVEKVKAFACMKRNKIDYNPMFSNMSARPVARF